MNKPFLAIVIACAGALSACADHGDMTSSMGNSGARSSDVGRGATGTSTSGDPLTNSSTGTASPFPTDPTTGQKKPGE